MPDILALLECLQPYMSRMTMGRWSRIIKAMLAHALYLLREYAIANLLK